MTVGNARPSSDEERFAEDLKRQRQAADGLEKDLLDDVPMLYGSPDGPLAPRGDPGIILAQIHREDMLRRNGYDISGASGPPSEVRLPFERTTGILAILLFAIGLLRKSF